MKVNSINIVGRVEQRESHRRQFKEKLVCPRAMNCATTNADILVICVI